MTKFYTQTGDDGYTGLLGEGRVAKYDLRLEAVGTLDEANAAIGLARALSRHPMTGSLLLNIQKDLYQIMAECAATSEAAHHFRSIDAQRVTWLEEQADQISAQVSIPDEFIVPGDSVSGGALDLARTIVRRAERSIAELIHKNQLENKQVLRYVNRLSSLCFILALLENQAQGNTSPTLAKRP